MNAGGEGPDGGRMRQVAAALHNNVREFRQCFLAFILFQRPLPAEIRASYLESAGPRLRALAFMDAPSFGLHVAGPPSKKVI